MTLFYSASTGGFYDDDINKSIPSDALEISSDEHVGLLADQCSGATIVPDGAGKPIAVAAGVPTLAQIQARLAAEIDAGADAAYIAIGGPSPGRLAEYQQANADAAAFKAAGYAGTVPPTVDCWATAAGLTAQAAADSILTTAAQWMSVLNAVRSARLLGKAAVNAAADANSAQAAADAALASIRQGAGAA